ncbi:hypothetical protein ACP70R_008326 [Stipagrostis hirtigluma subsp. patula]
MDRRPMPGGERPANKFVLFLRECLLLLALQVVTVTYVPGLNPPGGVWPETKDGHLIGNPILALTDHVRYGAFSYSNTTALMASAAVVLLLLFVRGRSRERPWFNTVLRVVMSLGTVALAAAYAAGASRNKFTTKFASALVALLFLYVAIYTGGWIFSARRCFSGDRLPPVVSRSMLTAIFVASMAYTAGLSPPGGFWQDTQEGHRAGDPALVGHHRRRFTAFFVGNTLAFVGSLCLIPEVLTNEGDESVSSWHSIALHGIFIAYAAGSSIDTSYIAYVLLCGFVVVPMMQFILVIRYIWPLFGKQSSLKKWFERAISGGQELPSKDGIDPFFILLFTTLSATVTYQAGLNPPGGLWLDDRDGHKAGDPILLAMQPTRYRVFIYCNSMALVVSLVAVVMVLTERCQEQKSRVLDGLMILDLIGLIGAYAAGCCRDVSTSIYVISLGGAVVAYVVFHMAFFLSRTNLEWLIQEDKTVEVDRDLMLGILGAALTYQTGLTPPGGFWPSNDEVGHHAGEPVLLSTYPSRYMVFFYLNAICFMASIFLTVLFVNPLLYRAGIRCHALYICVLAVLFGLMGAYAAGSYRNLGPSIYIIMLGAAVFIFIIIILYLLHIFEEAPETLTALESSNTNNLGLGQEGQQQDQPVDDVDKATTAAAEVKGKAEETAASEAAVTKTAKVEGKAEETAAVEETAEVEGNAEETAASEAAVAAAAEGKEVAAEETKAEAAAEVEAAAEAEKEAAATAAAEVEGTAVELEEVAAEEMATVEAKVEEVAAEETKAETVEEVAVEETEAAAAKAAAAKAAAAEAAAEAAAAAAEAAAAAAADKEEIKNKRLMSLVMIGSIGATVTYQAGFAPPQGFWPDDSNGHAVGNPVLRDTDAHWYRVFFFCNTTSFAASWIIMHSDPILRRLEAMIEEEELKQHALCTFVQAPTLIYAIGILCAYFAGSSSGWNTSTYAVALVAPVLFCIFGIDHVVNLIRRAAERDNASQQNDQPAAAATTNGEQAADAATAP